jgi:FHS family glucose/mannose:H+ symporter-like MFS transporter
MTGFGFGLSITTLNPLAASLFDDSKTSAILVLQFLVGLGTSTSPLMMGLISDIKDWIFIPAGIFVAVLISFILLIFIKLDSGTIFQLPKQFRIPSKLWLFFITIVFYGLLEGTFGGFGSVILKNIGLDNSSASIGLSLFWGGIAINRLLFGIFSRQYNLSVIFLISPLLIGVLLWLLISSSSSSIVLSLMFTIGFFMGSLFPGSIGWATVEFPQFAVLVSGSMMAANQIGTGIMTNTLGSFQNNSDLFSEILKYLSFIPIIIFALLMLLRKDSKIKEAF